MKTIDVFVLGRWKVPISFVEEKMGLIEQKLEFLSGKKGFLKVSSLEFSKIVEKMEGQIKQIGQIKEWDEVENSKIFEFCWDPQKVSKFLNKEYEKFKKEMEERSKMSFVHFVKNNKNKPPETVFFLYDDDSLLDVVELQKHIHNKRMNNFPILIGLLEFEF